MEVHETSLPGVLTVRPKVFADHRGFFLESFRSERYAEHGMAGPWVQDNQSRSGYGVLRGLHYQLLHPQGKLVRCSRGRVFDVVVDIRKGARTFGRWAGTILDDIEHQQLWIPPGFAHGFCVLSETADFEYKCTEFYHPEDSRGILWNDPDLGIDWTLDNPTLSSEDAALPRLAEADPETLPTYDP